MNNDTNMIMDWGDTIESDGQEFVILEEGDYNFTVTNFERGRFAGSAKIPACNKAALTLQVKTADGKLATIKFDLILYRSLEWRISSFFRCIGQKKQDERLAMDWNNAVGARGHARFKPRTYTNRDGEERQVNDVDKFYDWDEKYFPAEAKFTEISDTDELPWKTR